MRDLLRLLVTGPQGEQLPVGTRTIALSLACTAVAGILGDLLLYAVDLRAQGPVSVNGIVRALGPLLPGIVIVIATFPTIAAARRRYRWRLALLAGLTLIVAGAGGLYLIQVLHDDCGKIPGCTHRATVIYFVSFAQFLFFVALLAAWFALLAAVVRALWLSLRRAE